jgi:RIO kinase 1
MDADGNAAPRLNDSSFTPDEARRHHATMLREVVRMLLAGVIHGDLSEFNVLMAADGPVIIDLPQAVDAAGNNHAPAMLDRDVTNLSNYFGRYAPELVGTQYGKEIWSLYAGGLLTLDTPLSGHFEAPTTEVDVDEVLREVEDARLEEAARRERMAQTDA